MTTLQQDLRTLVANHGFEMIHTTLQDMMRQDYEFLSKIFKSVPVTNPSVLIATVPAIPSIPDTVPPPPPAPTTNQASKKMIRITVKKEIEEPIQSPVIHPPIAVESTTPVETPVNTIEMSDDKPKFRSPTEMKRFQKEAEMKKRAELDAKGISVASLMTRENLKKWIEEEGKTYAWVAREVIGCAETLVSTMSKNYGIQSKISKRKGIIMSRV